jgi:hypothetical protein
MKRACSMLVGVMVWMINQPSFAEEPSPRSMPRAKVTLPVSLDSLPAATRESIDKVIAQPTISALAPLEEFASAGAMYLWLLDHPNRVSLAWQRLNVGAVDITATRDGRFAWKDELGSELVWTTVAKNGEGRVWYAEGKVKPAMLLPMVPVKAVAVLRHGMRKNELGEPMIRHQVEVFLQTDSKAATLVTKMFGSTAPKMAEQGAEQLLLFFSGIARYVDRNPGKADGLLADKK